MNHDQRSHCCGPVKRRDFMKLGLAGFGSLTWPGLLKLKAENAQKSGSEKTAVIMVWLHGGLSHMDTYDPKPDIGSEYRGPFDVIDTNVPGVQITELLPHHARIADKFNIVRSMYHRSADHPAGTMNLLSGDFEARGRVKPKFPDWMSVASYMRSQAEGQRTNPLPNYIGVCHPQEYIGPAYLGNAYLPFGVEGDLTQQKFEVPNVGLSDVAEAARLGDRVALRQSLDLLERRFDRAMELQAVDEFEAQAMTLLTNPQTRDAFDLSQEDPATRDRYGRNQWGQQLLMSRRLIEAGVDIVTSALVGPLCGRVANWDDHAVNHHIFNGLRFRSEPYDQAVTALIEDIYERGLDQRVLVVVTGEFGRTPKIEYDRSTGPGNASAPTGVIQPGRDHWPRAFSNLWAGGGMRTGQVIGATDRRGEDVIERGCKAGDFLATIYQHLGIDYSHVMIEDFNGRPTAIVDDGKAIPELARVS
ncbi:MAG TPA: DUF1501 domain-containing protein [Planctomicrobium sp.]|nr:DUF1501 domain-containing protein [Planctomicrobium sp.]